MIELKYIDDVSIKISSDMGTLSEIADYFKFRPKGYQFSPKFKAKMWDGWIRIFSTYNCLLPAGLYYTLLEFLKFDDHEVIVDNKIKRMFNNEANNIEDFIAKQKLYFKGEQINLWDHQRISIIKTLKEKRITLLSPTSSGKSVIIYNVITYLLENTTKDILLVVPSVSLVHQMSSDFDEYYNADFESKYVHKIFSGEDKKTNKRIVCTTWQSVYKQPKSFFSKFGAVINDECHLAKAASITAIVNKMTDCEYKIGCTGTLEDSQISALSITGLFGPVYNVISTKKLMERGLVAQLKINNIIFKYPVDICKISTKLTYAEEIKYIVNYNKRNELISKMIRIQKDNSLFLANNVDHVKDMYERMKVLLKNTNRKVYIATGATPAIEREDMRKKVENEIGSVICATYGVLSTGFSLKNLYTIVFGSPTKSKIRTLQSLGRGLRISKIKNKVTLYDIIDDLSWKKHKNYALKHYIERMKMYTKEKFDYSINKIQL